MVSNSAKNSASADVDAMCAYRRAARMCELRGPRLQSEGRPKFFKVFNRPISTARTTNASNCRRNSRSRPNRDGANHNKGPSLHSPNRVVSIRDDPSQDNPKFHGPSRHDGPNRHNRSKP
jgi:hypothetical protein